MELIIKAILILAAPAVGYWFWRKKRCDERVDHAKTLVHDWISIYEDSETLLSVTVVTNHDDHFGSFKRAISQFSDGKRARLLELWHPYSEAHATFSQFGVFAPVVSILPHPDFEPSPENIQAVERKLRKQIKTALAAIYEEL